MPDDGNGRWRPPDETSRYARRGPVPQNVIEAVDFSLPPLWGGQVLVEVLVLSSRH